MINPPIILPCKYSYSREEVLIECFVNNFYKGYFLVNLKQSKTQLNEKYFSFLYPINTEGKVFVRRLNSHAVKLENIHLELIHLPYDIEEKMIILGFLGRDFFKGYQVVDIHKNKQQYVLRKIIDTV